MLTSIIWGSQNIHSIASKIVKMNIGITNEGNDDEPMKMMMMIKMSQEPPLHQDTRWLST
jgi:hypothetical protein